MVTETRAAYEPTPYVPGDDDFPEFDEGSDREALRAFRAFLKAHRQLTFALNSRQETETGRALTRKATIMFQVAYLWSKLPVIPKEAIDRLYMSPASSEGDPIPGRSIDDERKRIDDWKQRIYRQIATHYGTGSQAVARETNQALKDMLMTLRTTPPDEMRDDDLD